MSQTTGGSAMPDPQTAYTNLTEGVHAEVFFNKCAAAGLVPDTREDAIAMLQTAAALRGQAAQKQAADRGLSPFQQIKLAAEQTLGLNRPQYVEEATAIKQAADHFANDPTVYNSVLSLASVEAEGIRTQLSAR